MPPLYLLRIAPQGILNTLVSVCLLFATPVLTPASTIDPLKATVILNDSAAADQLVAQSSTLSFSDRMGTALVAHLPSPLSVDRTDTTDGYHAGDVAYIKDEQALVIFLVDGSAVPESGLIILGRLSSGLGDLVGCVRDCPLDLVSDLKT
ncbi:MAG: cyclophilin-like fold protein [Mycetocola sp.]